MTDAEFKRGSGGDPVNMPAPQGQATAVNRAAQAIEQPGLAPEEQLAYGISGKPSPSVPNPGTGDERLAFLTAPSERPAESLTYGLTSTMRVKPPANLGQWLPDVRAAAMEPDADPAVRRFYDLVIAHLGEQ